MYGVQQFCINFRHKKITDNNEKSGRGRSTWQYYDAMEELLAGDPAVRPIKVVASSTATPAAESTSTGLFYYNFVCPIMSPRNLHALF
jgi:hypothetical protein